jgi:NADH-quinone oxidoreductase subunit D
MIKNKINLNKSSKLITINIGPSHPATHGVLRLKLFMDGDKIVQCEPIIGYLHRGDEKIAESMTYNQFIPYTDRLDYISPIANNITYAIAVEKLGKIKTPIRCDVIRIICYELSRLSSHLLGIGVYGMDVGSWTSFMYCFYQREKIYSIFENLTGARFTTSYARIGGLSRDITEKSINQIKIFIKELIPSVKEINNLLKENKIFRERTEGVGIISKKNAVGYGLTGVNLRASGIGYDLRKDFPYSGYENYSFDIPIGEIGDCYDRYLIKIEEIFQSISIINQAINKIPKGPYYSKDFKTFLPNKKETLTRMESLIHNFMITTQGPKIKEGEIYFEAENPKGALGFYIVSLGGGTPYRMKIRSPSFCSLSILSEIVPGMKLTDITALLGSLDFVMGECDR